MSSIKYITFEEELEKNSELKISDIQILREWCNKQPHLPKIQDVELAIFLHSNYYHIEPTKNTIDNYYTFRTHVPEFFSNRDLHKRKKLQNAFQTGIIYYINDKTKEGYEIWVAQFIDMDPLHFFINETINVIFMIYEEFLWTHGSTLGHIIVLNGKSLTIGHIARFDLITLKKFIFYIQNALPIRLKGIHVINVSPLVEILFNIMKPLINAELMNLIHFHVTQQSANEYFPIELILNNIETGVAQELINTHLKKIENFSEWFLKDEKYNRVNESMRIDKSNITSDLYSVEGSFKKLEVD